MISFKPTYTIPSELDPSVSFTIKRLTSIERANQEIEHAEHFDALAQIRREHARLPDAVISIIKDGDRETAKASYPNDTPEQSDTRAALNRRFRRLVAAKIYPIVLGSCLQEVSGFESIEQFISTAADALLDEAYTFCEAASQLSPEQLKNLESPGTSNEAVAGQSEISIVPPADKAA